MKSKFTCAMIALAVMAALPASSAFAKRGADDPAGHQRHGRGADDAAGHVRHGHGADDATPHS
ncbi:hypothetical protein [Aestuariivirga sp.]|uniref:hypothetical protein n=1 Tax=Aestuariivirga sp. TaxID=2650926 RepID=UPI0039E63C66